MMIKNPKYFGNPSDVSKMSAPDQYHNRKFVICRSPNPKPLLPFLNLSKIHHEHGADFCSEVMLFGLPSVAEIIIFIIYIRSIS